MTKIHRKPNGFAALLARSGGDIDIADCDAYEVLRIVFDRGLVGADSVAADYLVYLLEGHSSRRRPVAGEYPRDLEELQRSLPAGQPPFRGDLAEVTEAEWQALRSAVKRMRVLLLAQDQASELEMRELPAYQVLEASRLRKYSVAHANLVHLAQGIAGLDDSALNELRSGDFEELVRGCQGGHPEFGFELDDVTAKEWTAVKSAASLFVSEAKRVRMASVEKRVKEGAHDRQRP